jgi:hypothetical protein
LISRQFASLTAPMGRPGRPTAGRPCEPFGFELSLESRTMPLTNKDSR